MEIIALEEFPPIELPSRTKTFCERHIQCINCTFYGCMTLSIIVPLITGIALAVMYPKQIVAAAGITWGVPLLTIPMYLCRKKINAYLNNEGDLP